MGKLNGKRALVTGGGQGIGRGIALALAAKGASVAVMGRTPDKVEKAAAEIEERGVASIAITGDLKSSSDVDAAIARVVEVFGGVDILVNNAQEYGFGPIAHLDEGQFIAGWESGALGTLRMMRAAYPHLQEGGGVVVNVSSSVASSSDPSNAGGYAAVKAAIATLSRAAAVEWAADGIRVMTLIPFALTPAVQASIEGYEGLEEQILSQVPLGRFGEAEDDIGRVVAFAASDDARFMTGSSLVVDGGSTHLT
ncbi:MAG: SDR family NAD(P)-dependent oxidoreductase [Actinobacteria bacterium]|nr:MAG: SDR family NAD(P)-dependent oxidoreductase [Actinomycetota bacterium]